MTKWKKLSDAALKASNFDLCESASQASNDYAGLLLMYSAIGNYVGLENLAKSAEADGKTNIAFSAYLLTGNVEACAEILISTNRLPEAAFFARTYLPSRVDEIVAMWKADLSKVSESAAAALISPSMDKESFPDFDVGLQVEQMFMDQRASNKEDGIPATDYLSAKDDLDLDLVDLVKSRSQAAEPVAPPPAESPEMEDDNGEEKVPDEETDIVDSDTIEADEAMKTQLEALAAEQAL
eukprot:1000132_1